MVLTPSRMPPLGGPMPDFQLPDPSGRVFRRAVFDPYPGLLVVFLCNHCPYVIHVRDELAALSRDLPPRGVGMVGINANDIEAYPDDAPPRMAAEAARSGWDFPYLFDAAQSVAQAFGAACTPDFFLFDTGRRLYYRGQLDDSRPGNGRPVTGRDLRAAVDRLLAGQPPPPGQIPSIGCNIKWRPGHTPA